MSPLRTAAATLMLALACASAYAQGQGAPDAPAALSVSEKGVRFAAPNRVARLKLEVLSPSGEVLYEAASRGSVLDWTVSDSQGARLPDGAYLGVLTVKDLSGRITQRLTVVEVVGGVASARPAAASEMTPQQAAAVGPVEAEAAGVVSPAEAPAAALLAHDGETGQLVTTAGDLSFRGGDFFTGRDRELMRLSQDGSLEVSGSLLARGGIRFADGTVLDSARGLGRSGSGGKGAKADLAAVGDGTVTASATVNRLAKFSSTGGAIVDSAITEDASGNVGIGTNAPGGVFDLQRSSSSDILQRLWNKGAGGAKLRYVAATGATSQLQMTDATGWLMSMAVSRGAGVQFRLLAPGQLDVESTLASSARMTILPAGNVGIGTTAPAHRLDVVGNVRVAGTGNGLLFPDGTKQTSAGIASVTRDATLAGGGTTASPLGLADNSVTSAKIADSAITNADISPSAAISPSKIAAGLTPAQISTAGAAAGQVLSFNGTGLVYATPAAGLTGAGATGKVPLWTGASALSNSLITQADGSVTVAGNLSATGNLAAKYQDVAEWVPGRGLLPAGTVVVLDRSRTNGVVASSRAYSTHVAGVISPQPGLILGEGGPGQVLVATTGRVRVRVDATRSPIRVGDLLVTGGAEGTAIRSVPVRAGRARLHRPGTIVGKALEPLATGTGEILVLLSLQ